MLSLWIWSTIPNAQWFFVVKVAVYHSLSKRSCSGPRKKVLISAAIFVNIPNVWLRFYRFFFFLLTAEIAKLGDVFASSAAETTTTSRHQIERTSIRTYYSNVDLTTTVNPNGIPANDDPRTMRNDKYYNAQQSARHQEIQNYSTSRFNGQQQQDSFYSHYDELNERVRSPSLPPIGRNKNRLVLQHMDRPIGQRNFIEAFILLNSIIE